MTISQLKPNHNAKCYWLYGKQLQEAGEKDLGVVIDGKLPLSTIFSLMKEKTTLAIAVFKKTFFR